MGGPNPLREDPFQRAVQWEPIVADRRGNRLPSALSQGSRVDDDYRSRSWRSAVLAGARLGISHGAHWGWTNGGPTGCGSRDADQTLIDLPRYGAIVTKPAMCPCVSHMYVGQGSVSALGGFQD